MPNILYNNSSIYYDDFGQGEPIILLHGFLESSHMWDAYARDLRENYRIVTIDFPGHGLSDSTESHSMDAMAQVVKAVMSKLKISKAKFIGHSMGGYVALALADSNPNLVDKILLFFSSAAADNAEKRKNRERVKKLAKRSKNTFLRISIGLLFTLRTRTMHSNIYINLVRDAQKMEIEAILKTVDGLKERPSRLHLLQQSRIPISFVSGKNDQAITFETVSSQHKAVAVNNVWVTENGHMGHIEDEVFCLAVIKNFLS